MAVLVAVLAHFYLFADGAVLRRRALVKPG